MTDAPPPEVIAGQQIELKCLSQALDEYHYAVATSQGSAANRAEEQLVGIQGIFNSLEHNARQLADFAKGLCEHSAKVRSLARGLMAHASETRVRAKLANIEYRGPGRFSLTIDLLNGDEQTQWKLGFINGRWSSGFSVSSLKICQQTGFPQDSLAGVIAATELLSDAYDVWEARQAAGERQLRASRDQDLQWLACHRDQLENQYRLGRHNALAQWRAASAGKAPSQPLPAAISGVRHLREYDLGGPCHVYFLIDGDEVVYVGQSRDLTHRIETHLKDERKKFDRVLTLECDRRSLLATESHFIRLLRPRYNEANNPDKPSRRSTHSPSPARPSAAEKGGAR